MATKWERQVERNAKKVNLQRKRMGQTPISQASKKDNKHKGRSWMFALFLVFVGAFYMVTFWETERNGLYWLTVIMYFILAVIIFFLRRPFLGINKDSLVTRKFTGNRIMKADEIKKIEIQSGIIIIEFKDSTRNWVFSRLLNRFNITAMAAELQEFSIKNNVNFVKLV